MSVMVRCVILLAFTSISDTSSLSLNVCGLFIGLPYARRTMHFAYCPVNLFFICNQDGCPETFSENCLTWACCVCTNTHQMRRGTKKACTFKLSEEAREILKIAALVTKTTKTDLLESAIRKRLAKYAR